MTRRSSTHTEAAVEMPALAHTLGTALPTLCFEHLNLSRATVRFICGRHVASWDRISTLRLSLTLYTALHLRSHPELAPKTLLSVGRATPWPDSRWPEEIEGDLFFEEKLHNRWKEPCSYAVGGSYTATTFLWQYVIQSYKKIYSLWSSVSTSTISSDGKNYRWVKQFLYKDDLCHDMF